MIILIGCYLPTLTSLRIIDDKLLQLCKLMKFLFKSLTFDQKIVTFSLIQKILLDIILSYQNFNYFKTFIYYRFINKLDN